MNLKCNCCGRSEDLSPLRIGRPHARCFTGKGVWVEPNHASITSAKPTTERK